MTEAIRSSLDGKRNQPRHVVGRRHVQRIEARRIGVGRVVEPSSVAFSFIRPTNGLGAVRRDARERACRGVVGRDERQVQEVVDRHVIVRAQVGVARA